MPEFQRLLLGLAVATCVTVPSFAQSVPQVILIQNSGWMEPFFLDPTSEFKPLVKALSTAVGSAGEETILLSFNQSSGSNESPKKILKHPFDQTRSGAEIDRLEIAFRQGKAVYADTDFMEAITKTINNEVGGRSAVIWLITNNKNSPNNSAETVRRNREFYEFLHTQPEIKRIAAWPLAMAVKGPHFKANGLMVYAIAYGQKADVALLGKLGNPVLRKLLSSAPARLKPQNQQALMFEPQSGTKSDDIHVSLSSDRRTIDLVFDAGLEKQTAHLAGVFRNALYPYQIDRARISAKFRSHGDSVPVEAGVSPAMLAVTDAGEISSRHTLTLSIPPVPSIWSPAVIFSDGYRTVGELEIDLTDQHLSISPAFAARMAQIFPGDPLPDLFKPSSESNSSRTVVPVAIAVTYPIMPLLIVVAVGVLLAALAVICLILGTREARFSLVVNGQARKLTMRAWRSEELRDDRGDPIARVKRGFGKPRVVWAKDGQTVSVS